MNKFYSKGSCEKLSEYEQAREALIKNNLPNGLKVLDTIHKKLSSNNMKDLDLKESEITEAETLEHCLTVIQGVLDMDDFEQACNYLSGYTKALLSQQRKEVLEEVLKGLPEKAPQIINILGTVEEDEHNEPLRTRISGFNSCLIVVENLIKSLINKQ